MSIAKSRFLNAPSLRFCGPSVSPANAAGFPARSSFGAAVISVAEPDVGSIVNSRPLSSTP